MKVIFIGLDAGDIHLNLNEAGINTYTLRASSYRA
jgi:hypothetical protein